MDNQEFCKDARKLISGFPDLARLISRFGNLSIGIRPSDHPDKRAVMYEEILYNRQKTRAFCRVLSSFKDFDAWIKKQSAANGDILKILQLVDNDNIVIEDLLSNWRKTFDMEKAKREEKLTPKEGANPPFDRAVKEIKRIQDEAEAFRTEVADNYGHGKLLKSGKLHFVIQVRDTVKAPNEWTSIGLTKGFKKYQAPELDDLNKEMDRYVNLKDMALSEASSVIFGEFYKTSNRWLAIVKMIDELDALISFANYGHTIEERCFPEVFDEGEVLR
jgi:DNA mismatch repair protein MSH6